MGIFEDVYNKYLKIEKEEIETYKYKNVKMTQGQQINFLKSLGKQNLGYDEYKVDSYSKKINNNSYGAYIVRIPIIDEPILDKDCNIIEQPLKFYYKTCIIAINENDLVIDNVCLFKNEDIELVKQKFNELCNIINSSNEVELLTLIDNEISSKI